MQALAETVSQMLKQLVEGKDTAVQQEASLQVLLQMQVQWPHIIAAHSTSQPHCLRSFINAKVGHVFCTGLFTVTLKHECPKELTSP